MTGPLDTWLYFLRYAERLDPTQLPETLKTPEIARAVEESRMVTQSDLERERYEARVKVQRDALSSLLAATEKGLTEGLKKGLRKGQLIGKIQVFQKMLHQPETPAKELLDRPVAELEALALQLERLANPGHANGK